MNILGKLKNNKYLVSALVFTLLNLIAIVSIFGCVKHSDTKRYVETINWFQAGMQGEIGPIALTRPLGPMIAVPFQFLGDGAGLIVQNILFYFFSSYLIFKITELVFNSKVKAFFASIFFVTATPLLEFGLAFLTDMGAWSFYLFSLYLTLLYLKSRNDKLIIINGLFSGIGFLMKENAALGALFFGLMILFSKNFDLKDKVLKIAKFGVFLLIPIIMLQFFMFKYFRYTSFDWYLTGGLPGANREGLLLMSFRYLGQLFRVMGILWPFVLIGMLYEWQKRNWERLKVFLALLPSSFSFLLWNTSAGGRSVFIFAPLGILLATRGLSVFGEKLGEKIKKPTMVLLVLALIAFNYCFSLLNPGIAFVDILAEFLGIL